ncbi:DUF1127 domain-containing protein [Aliiroseovarius sediminilitoris]|nr:DUF1127 domain-containing protein [Aliiroseovarius sediminilitoris]
MSFQFSVTATSETWEFRATELRNWQGKRFMTARSQGARSDRGFATITAYLMSKSLYELHLVTVRIGSKALAKAHIALKALQMTRMLSTLSKLSDHQLAQIGITRSDIPSYAEKLMKDD